MRKYSINIFLCMDIHLTGLMFPTEEINIAVPETGDLGDSQAGSDGKEHGQIDHGFLLLTQI